MGSIFDFIAHSERALWLFSGLIVVTALYFGFKYYRAIQRLRRDLLALAAVIRELPVTADRSQIRAAIDESHVASTYIAKRFRRWVLTLIQVVGDSESRYRSTVHPDEGLDLAGVAAASVNFRLIHGIPNVLIGMGLLFTFLGLTAALMFATQGATAGNVILAQQSLNGLLGAATFKFVTSLVGITCSIAFGFFEKGQFKALESAFADLTSLLSVRFPFVSAQQLLEIQQRTAAVKRVARLSALETIGVLNESFENPVGLALIGQNIERTREEAEEQTAILKRFDTDLAASIAKAINESLTPQLTNTFDRLQERIDLIGHQLSSTNTEALRTIITDFSEQFQAQAQSSFDSMISAMSILTTNIGQHSDRFAQSFEAVQQVVSAMREEGGRALAGVHDTMETFNVTVTRLEGLSELLQQAAEPLSHASEAASSAIGRVYETQTAATEMLRRLEGVAGGFSGIDNDLSAAFSAMHSGFERVTTDLRKFVSELDGSFSKALGGVHEVTSSLDSNVESFVEGLEAFQRSVASFQTIAERLEIRAIPLPPDAPPLNGSGAEPSTVSS